MTDYARERRLQKKREYYREWRKKNPESVKASQARYWAKKAEDMRQSASLPADMETRSMEDH